MAWFKVDDLFDGSEKEMKCSLAAIGLWTKAGSWASRRGTDGHIPTAYVERAGAADEAAELVRSGLWEATDEGWLFHDWTDYNPTAAEVKDQRRKRAEAGRMGGLAKQTSSKRLANAKQVLSKTEANGSKRLANVCPVPVPVPVLNTNTRSHPLAETDPSFEAWYQAFPRHTAKAAAAKAYRTALKSASVDALLDGAQRYARSVTDTEARFIKHPATWLNGQCWLDETPAEPELKPIPMWWER